MPKLIQYAPTQLGASAPLPQTGDFGLGAGIAAIGDELTGLGAQLFDRNYQSETADYQARVAELQAANSQAQREAVEAGIAHTPEFVAESTSRFAEQLAKVGEGLNNPAAKRDYELYSVQARVRETESTLLINTRARASKQAADVRTAQEGFINQVANNPTSFEQSLATFRANLEGPAYSLLGPEEKVVIRQQFEAELAHTYLSTIELNAGANAALSALDDVEGMIPQSQIVAMKNSYTNRAKQENNKLEAAAREEGLLTAYKLIQAGGDGAALADELLAKGAIGELDAIRILQWQESESRSQQSKTDATNLFYNAAVSFTDGKASYESFPKATREAVEKEYYKLVMETKAPDEALKLLTEKSMQTGAVFSDLKDTLSVSPLNNEKYGNANTIYQAMKAMDAPTAYKYVDKAKQASFDAYNIMIRNDVPEELARERSDGIDLKLARAAINARVAKAANKNHVFSEAGIDKNTNGYLAYNSILDDATVIASLNKNISAEDALEQAAENYKLRNTKIDIGDKTINLPKEFTALVPDKEAYEGVINYYFNNMFVEQVAEVKEKHGASIVITEGAYTVIETPDTERTGLMQVVDPTGMPIAGFLLGPNDFAEAYLTMVKDKVDTRESREALRREKAREAAGGLF